MIFSSFIFFFFFYIESISQYEKIRIVTEAIPFVVVTTLHRDRTIFVKLSVFAITISARILRSFNVPILPRSREANRTALQVPSPRCKF